MGNSDLRKLCNIEEIDVNKVKGCKCVIDGHNWLYKYMTISSEYNDVKDYTFRGNKHPEIIGLTMGISKLLEYNLKPVVVFDGGYNELKQEELNKRRKSKEEAQKKKEKVDDKIKKAKYRARTQKVTKDTLDVAEDILDIFNVNYMYSPNSAESQASYMCENGDFEYVISDDYDTVVFKSPFTLRNFTSSTRPLERISLSKTLEENDISYEELINAYILCGTDYNDGVNGVGPVTSVRYVNEYDSMSDLFREKDFKIDNYDEIYNIFKNPEIKEDFASPNNIEINIDSLKSYLPENVLTNKNVKNSIEKMEEKSKTSTLSDF